VILTKGRLSAGVPLVCLEPWANEELQRLEGNFLSATIVLDGVRLNVVSAYSPAWPVTERLAGVDLSKVRLPGNPSLWATELLWLALINTMNTSSDPWVIGGDFNSSETFDFKWGPKPRGNAEVLNRMSALSLTECLRKVHGKLVPTVKNPRGEQVVHQLDHLWVSEPFPLRLEGCVTGDPGVVFGGNLSDHLPVCATFTASSIG
jgi:endonuclease/exonuclease/phosphatase family metal-dependent hydrolase